MSDSLQPIDCGLPGSSVHRIFQARILKEVATSYSKGIFLIQGSNPLLFLASPALVGGFFTTEPLGKPLNYVYLQAKTILAK